MNAIKEGKEIVLKNKNRIFLNLHPKWVQKNCTPSGFGKKIAPPRALSAKELHPLRVGVASSLSEIAVPDATRIGSQQ